MTKKLTAADKSGKSLQRNKEIETDRQRERERVRAGLESAQRARVGTQGAVTSKARVARRQCSPIMHSTW